MYGIYKGKLRAAEQSADGLEIAMMAMLKRMHEYFKEETLSFIEAVLNRHPTVKVFSSSDTV